MTIDCCQGNFVHPKLPVTFGRDTISRWSGLPGVREVKYPTRSKFVPYSGFKL